MDSIDKLYKSVTLILLLLTTNSVLKTSSYWANGPEPPSMPLPPIPKEEEVAVNDLFTLAEVPLKLQNSFSTSRCDQKSIFCDCNTTSCHVTEMYIL
ncbi:hypothetical protein HAX54_018205 [Datura stramonium]|uniref:Uncharacterized protein n=1 Tax=Datura stramonium TaxID=4076 RepID=A0ABS8Y4N1_DATST|nr:hypothetical protein [Datura stramonium]